MQPKRNVQEPLWDSTLCQFDQASRESCGVCRALYIVLSRDTVNFGIPSAVKVILVLRRFSGVSTRSLHLSGYIVLAIAHSILFFAFKGVQNSLHSLSSPLLQTALKALEFSVIEPRIHPPCPQGSWMWAEDNSVFFWVSWRGFISAYVHIFFAQDQPHFFSDSKGQCNLGFENCSRMCSASIWK